MDLEIKEYQTLRLVKSEDLNHHRTLYAGRTSEWFVESGFVAVGATLKPDEIVCVKIHGMHFSKPINPGQTIRFTSKIIQTGTSSVTVYVKVDTLDSSNKVVDGFITFVNVDGNTKPKKHGINLIINNDEDRKLSQIALGLKRDRS